MGPCVSGVAGSAVCATTSNFAIELFVNCLLPLVSVVWLGVLFVQQPQTLLSNYLSTVCYPLCQWCGWECCLCNNLKLCYPIICQLFATPCVSGVAGSAVCATTLNFAIQLFSQRSGNHTLLPR